MDLPTYTNIWRIEKRLYKLYDVRLPAPLPINLIIVFAGITIPYIFILYLLGVPVSHTLVWLYVLPPGVLTWLSTRPVIEGKRLPELVESQVRYLAEPRVWARMAPLEEKDQVVVSAQVWHSRRVPKEAAEQATAGASALRMRGRLVPRNELARSGEAAAASGAVPDAGLAIVRSDAGTAASRETAPGKSRSGSGRPARVRPAVFRPGGRARGGSERLMLPGSRPDPESLAARPAGRAPSLPPAADHDLAPSAPAPASPWQSRPQAGGPAHSGPLTWPSANPAPSAPATGPAPTRPQAARPAPSASPTGPAPTRPQAVKPAPTASPLPSGRPTWPSAPAGSLPGLSHRPAPPVPLGQAVAPVHVTLPPHATPDVHPVGIPVREDAPDDAEVKVPEAPVSEEAPVSGEAPAPAEPGPAEPGPAEPGPAEPGPAEPGPVKPEPAPVRARSGGVSRLPAVHSEADRRPPPTPSTSADPARGWPFQGPSQRPASPAAPAPVQPTRPERPAPQPTRPESVPSRPTDAGSPSSPPAVPDSSPRKRVNPIATALAAISDGQSSARIPGVIAPKTGPAVTSPGIGSLTSAGTGSAPGTGTKAPAGTPTIERALSGKSRDRNLSWHGTVKVVTGKTQGPGARDQEALDRARARLPLKGPKRVLMLGCTSGAGQTVTTLMTGHILGSLREEAVAAVDLNDGSLARFSAPAGSLEDVLRGQPPQHKTGPRPDGLNPNAKGSQARLDVIASTGSLRDGDEIKMAVQLGRHYPLTMLDPGAHGMNRLLKVADQLVIVVPASVEAAGALADTREWLDAHGFAELVAHSVTLINGVSRRSLADVEAAESVARGRCRAIVRVPWDEGLPVGVAGPSTLRPQTRVAYTALAGVLVAGMAAAPVRIKK